MTRKSRVFSALAIAAAGTLMITTTAYQSKAADGVVNGNYHIDDGTGYAGGEVAAVTGLNTTSTGTFRYDAPGTDEDIEIASGDIKSLENAVKALSAQVTGLGDTAKAADMALDTGAATAIGNLGTTNSTAMGQIKGSIDTLTQQINTLNETLTSKSFGASSGTPVKTSAGTVDASRCMHLSGDDLFHLFGVAELSVPYPLSDYVIFLGNYTTDQLVAGAPWSYKLVNLGNVYDQTKVEANSGLLGRLACTYVVGKEVSYGTAQDGYIYYIGERCMLTLRGESRSNDNTLNILRNSIFTLVPIIK